MVYAYHGDAAQQQQPAWPAMAPVQMPHVPTEASKAALADYIKRHLHPGQRPASNHWQLIGCRPNATEFEVATRVRAVKMHFHPDKCNFALKVDDKDLWGWVSWLSSWDTAN